MKRINRTYVFRLRLIRFASSSNLEKNRNKIVEAISLTSCPACMTEENQPMVSTCPRNLSIPKCLRSRIIFLLSMFHKSPKLEFQPRPTKNRRTCLYFVTTVLHILSGLPDHPPWWIQTLSTVRASIYLHSTASNTMTLILNI